MTRAFKLRGVALAHGYRRGKIGDAGGFDEYVKDFEAAKLVAVIKFSGSMVPEQDDDCFLFSLGFHA
jgi:hypothetical protein